MTPRAASVAVAAGGRPRLLDLFCGAGGCARGYQRAGFYVVGIDNRPMPRYAGDEFIQADALVYCREHGGEFDVIHASPPCQAHTTMNNRHGSTSPDLIAETRAVLEAVGVPWVLENVLGARSAMRSPLRLTGAQFGLGVHRPRLFESSVCLMSPGPMPRRPDAVAVYGALDGRRLWTRSDGSELRAPRTIEPASAAMGIDWMTWDELRQAIPPAYTKWIGAQLLAVVMRQRASVPA